MAMIEQETTLISSTQHQRVTRDELLAELDRRARADLGLSAEEFMERLRTGELDPESAPVAELAFLARVLERASGSRPRDRRRRWFRSLGLLR